MAEAKKSTLVATSVVHHDGRTYQPGDDIDLTAEQEQRLRKAGSVDDHSSDGAKAALKARARREGRDEAHEAREAERREMAGPAMERFPGHAPAVAAPGFDHAIVRNGDSVGDVLVPKQATDEDDEGAGDGEQAAPKGASAKSSGGRKR